MIQTVIFNLDGILVSTDDCHFEAWARLAQEQGIPLTEEIYRAMVGKKRMDSLLVMLKKAERSYSAPETWALAARKNDIFNSLVRHLTPDRILPGAVETVRALREMGVKTAVGSSSENAGGILRQMKMDKLFDAIVDGGQIEKGKPDPEVFLTVARKLRTPTSQCLVVENTWAGVEAAHQAGMKALALGAAVEQKKEGFHPMSLADIDLPGMVRDDTFSQFTV